MLQKFYIHLKWVKLSLLLVRVVFTSNSSKLSNLDKTTARQVSKIAVIEPVAVIELGPFLGVLGPILTQNLVLFQVWLLISCRILLKNRALLQKFENNGDFIEITQFDKAVSMGVSRCQIRICHDDWDWIIFETPIPIPAQLSSLPNQTTNSIKCPKKRPQLWKNTIFYCYMRFFIIPCASAHLNALYEKSWPTIFLYGSWNMFQTFLLANFLSGSACKLI